jgi:hypothetical protein
MTSDEKSHTDVQLINRRKRLCGVEMHCTRHPPNETTQLQEFLMKALRLSVIAMGAGLLMAAPAFAQTTPAQKQQTQDGGSPTQVGPASAAYKQKTQDGGSPTLVGPASGAYKQKTQSLSHGDIPVGVAKQN